MIRVAKLFSALSKIVFHLMSFKNHINTRFLNHEYSFQVLNTVLFGLVWPDRLFRFSFLRHPKEKRKNRSGHARLSILVAIYTVPSIYTLYHLSEIVSERKLSRYVICHNVREKAKF